MANIENVTINGKEAYLFDGFLHTADFLHTIKVKK
jgi:hypothetical protein